MDMLSNLPPDVTDHILKLLPIKEAARTSLVSQSWRHRWRSIPHLVLDRNFATLTPRTDNKTPPCEDTIKVTMEIYRALILHKGPITKFVLAIPGLRPSPEIDHIVLHLAARGGLRELSLRFGEDRPDPFDFLAWVRGLKEEAVRASLPTGAGFEKLTRLELKQVVLPSGFFDHFVPNKCPLLEELRISTCAGASTPKIVAPRLRALYFHSFLRKISFDFTPLLSMVSILETGLYSYVQYRGYKEAGADTAAVFASLPALRELTLGLEFLLLLAEGANIPGRLPTPLHHLTVLEIPYLCLSNLTEAKVLVCLIMSSPILCRLTIWLDDGDARGKGAKVDSLQEMLEAEKLPPGSSSGGSSYCLECLEVFNIQNSSVGELQLEMELVRFVLANAKHLRRALITPLPDLEATSAAKYLKEVTGYRRASGQAQIIYEWDEP